MGILHLRQWAYNTYGYERTTPTATGVLGLWLWAHYTYGYGHSTPAATAGLCLWLRGCYRHTVGVQWGVSQPLVTTAAIVKGKSDD